jgi:PIN domain nuclease of toxin-antitoxin system
MIVGVADTHAVLWYLYDDAQLSVAGAAFIEQAATTGCSIAVSAISLVELVYLADKGRLPRSAFDSVAAALVDPKHVFVEVPVSASIVAGMWQVSRAEVPDMPDRIIAATGVHLGVPVISRDRRIRAASLSTIW